MEKIKRFIECHIPITNCNLRCHYCYVTHHRLFVNKIPKFKYPPDHVRKALSKKRMGGVCLINFCASGETLLVREITEYIRVLLEEGHYVMVVTNATISKRFDEICNFPKDLLNRLFFKFSYQYLELKRKSKLDAFWGNVKKAGSSGCSFTVEVTPSDELIPYIDEMNQRALEEVGTLPHVTIARDERDSQFPILTSMNRKDYIDVWGKFESSLFDFKESIFGVKRKEFCYAGDWSFTVDLGTGRMKQCYKSLTQQNIFKDIDKPIIFSPIGNNCREPHCFNGHAWIALGDIPELPAPSYAELRNKTGLNGKEWLTPDMKSFMNTKLYESNREYSCEQKNKINKQNRRLLLKYRTKDFLKDLLWYFRKK